MWRVTSIPSASLEQSIKISKDIENALTKYPEVKTTVAMIGRAEKGETADVNYMEIYTELNPEDEWPEKRTVPELADQMREELEQVVAEGVTDMELSRVLSRVRAHEAYLRDGPYSMAAQLNEAIAAGDWRLYANRMERMEQVTGDQVKAAEVTGKSG